MSWLRASCAVASVDMILLSRKRPTQYDAPQQPAFDAGQLPFWFCMAFWTVGSVMSGLVALAAFLSTLVAAVPAAGPYWFVPGLFAPCIWALRCSAVALSFFFEGGADPRIGVVEDCAVAASVVPWTICCLALRSAAFLAAASSGVNGAGAGVWAPIAALKARAIVIAIQRFMGFPRWQRTAMRAAVPIVGAWRDSCPA